MKKFLLLVFIFLFGVLIGGTNTAESFNLPVNNITVRTDGQIYSEFTTQQALESILTNNKYSISEPKTLDKNYIDLYCPYNLNNNYSIDYLVINLYKTLVNSEHSLYLFSVSPRAP